MRRLWRFILLGTLSAFTFLIFLDGPDIVTSHEARVAQPAKLMAASGWPWSATPVHVPAVVLRPGVVRLEPDYSVPPIAVNPWLVPVLTGKIRLQKPPLPYWCAAVLLKIAGGAASDAHAQAIDHVFDKYGELLVRLIPALMGAIATFLLFDLAIKIFGEFVGWCTALAWVSTYAACEMYRKAMADPYLAFFTLLCVWAWIVAAMRADDKSRGTRGLLVVFYASLGLALLAKGPPAIVAILFPLAAYHFCFSRRLPGRLGSHLVGIVTLFLIAAPWPLYVWRNVPHAMDVWKYESVGELSDNTENARQWWFYLPQLFYLAMPWTPLWVVGCVLPFKTSSNPATARGEAKRDLSQFFPLIWWGATIVFFSFLNQKKNAYLLPALPAQAMIIGLALASLLKWVRETRFKGAAGAMVMTQVIIGIAVAAVLSVLLSRKPEAAHALPIASLAVVFAGIPLMLMLRRLPEGWAVTQAVAYTLLVTLTWRHLITPMDDSRSARPVAREIARLCENPEYTVLMSRMPEEVAVYLPTGMTYGFGPKILIAIDDTRGVHDRAIAGTILPEPKVESFQALVPDAKVMGVRRIALHNLPEDYRWKVFELTAQRRGYAIAWRENRSFNSF